MQDGGRWYPEPGEIVLGRYDVVREIGRGSFAVVYELRLEGMLQRLAMKVPRPDVEVQARHMERFVQEAKLLHRLCHPNTVTVHELGQLGPRLPCYVMELLDGPSLAEHLEQHGPLPVGQVWALAVQILGALEEAHAYGMVHRDVKPDNIVLGRDWKGALFPKLVDFGIARVFGEQGDAAPGVRHLTQAGLVLGSPGYMAPELITGTDIGPAVDLYSLGLTLVAALTGSSLLDEQRIEASPELRAALEGVLGRRFTASAPDAIELIGLHASRRELPLPESVAQGPLGPVIWKAIAKDQRRRFHDAASMAENLLDVAEQIPDRPKLPDWCRRIRGSGVPSVPPRRFEPAPAEAHEHEPVHPLIPPRPGDLLAERYRIVQEIPGSSQSLAYQAIDVHLERPVLVKVLRPIPSLYNDMRDRFALEMKVIGRLSHPALIKLHDCRETPAGMPYMVLEWLEGESVAQRIQRSAPLSDEAILALARQLLGALATAHAQGILHRNLKPSNVFLCRTAGSLPAAKLLDFGLAKLLPQSRFAGKVPTLSGMILGTVAYIAPEQIRSPVPPGPTADIYSLGLTLIAARLGQALFEGWSPVETLQAQVSPEELELPESAFAGALGAILRRATWKKPSRRYPTAERMLEAVERALVSSRAGGTDPHLPRRTPATQQPTRILSSVRFDDDE